MRTQRGLVGYTSSNGACTTLASWRNGALVLLNKLVKAYDCTYTISLFEKNGSSLCTLYSGVLTMFWNNIGKLKTIQKVNEGFGLG